LIKHGDSLAPLGQGRHGSSNARRVRRWHCGDEARDERRNVYVVSVSHAIQQALDAVSPTATSRDELMRNIQPQRIFGSGLFALIALTSTSSKCENLRSRVGASPIARRNDRTAASHRC
jgi:hypothetical protein